MTLNKAVHFLTHQPKEERPKFTGLQQAHWVCEAGKKACQQERLESLYIT